MNDTNREAEIRERVQFEVVHPARYFEDIPYLLSALDSEREARRTFEEVLLRLRDNPFWTCDCHSRTEASEMNNDASWEPGAVWPNPIAHDPRCTVHIAATALLTTEDSNKTQEEAR